MRLSTFKLPRILIRFTGTDELQIWLQLPWLADDFGYELQSAGESAEEVHWMKRALPRALHGHKMQRLFPKSPTSAALLQ